MGELILAKELFKDLQGYKGKSLKPTIKPDRDRYSNIYYTRGWR
jgi:hypothetical protein